MPPDFRIESATSRDVPAVLQMIRSLAEYERLADRVVATEEDLQRALFGARPYAEVVLGLVNDEPVGFALFFHNFSTFRGAPGLYLEDLFVHEPWRGRGFGRKLLAHVASIAVDRGCHRFEWSVLDWNEPAIGFYRHVGAQLLDDWRIVRLAGDALQALAAESVPRLERAGGA